MLSQKCHTVRLHIKFQQLVVKIAIIVIKVTYKIPATSGQNCDHCNKSATFMHHSRDHMGQNFIELTCDDHSPPRYKEYTSE